MIVINKPTDCYWGNSCSYNLQEILLKWKKKIIKIFLLILIIFVILFFIYEKKFKKTKNDLNKVDASKWVKEEFQSNSNIIKDVKYVSRDAKGNEYIIQAFEGEEIQTSYTLKMWQP